MSRVPNRSRLFALSLLALVLISCNTATPSYSPFLRAEPAPGAALSRAPRTLRLYFDALPDVERSSLRLIGADGEQQLRGMHSMAADDLMAEILDSLTPGTYTVEWRTVVGDDPAEYSGSFEFNYRE